MSCVARHPQAIPMLCSAFSLLGTLGRGQPALATHLKSDSERPSLIPAAMLHVDHVELLMRSCTIYMLLALDDADFALKITKEMKGTKAIIEALVRYPDDAGLQSSAFEALWQISLCASTRDSMTIDNIIPLVCKAMKKHKGDRNVQEYACRLLSGLMVNDTTNQKAVHQEGSTRLLIGAMKNHVNDESVQASTAEALSLIVNKDFPEHVQSAVKEGAVPLIANAMKLAPQNLELQSSTCAAAESFSGGDDNVKLVLIKEGCVCLLLRAGQAHAVVASLAETSTSALCNLASLSSPQVKQEFNEEAGAMLMELLLENHAANAGIQRNCAMLSSMFTG